MKLFDISWPITTDMTGYKDKKEHSFEPIKTIEKDGVRESRIALGSHAGTHVDAPSHFLVHGNSIDQIPLSQLVGDCRVLDLTFVKNAITADDLSSYDIKKGERVLLKTTNSNHAATAHFDYSFVYLDETGARYLADKGISAVGIDYLGIERGRPDHPVHTIFFTANITVIEGLRLCAIEEGFYFLVCLPLAIGGLEAAPARAVLLQYSPNDPVLGKVKKG